MAAFALIAAVAASTAAPLAGQVSKSVHGRFEVRGLDFTPNGGWRARVNGIRAIRHEFMRAGAIRSLNLNSASAFGGTKVTGHVYVPVVPIAFRNVPAPFTAAQIQAQLFSAAPSNAYSLKTFYEQLSNGNISLDGEVFPWVTVDSSDVYYEDGCHGVGVGATCPNGGRRFGAMLLQALSAVSNGASAATVWAQFDNDGPDGVPNSGDDDGVVDFVTFLQADVDGACHTAHIWAHRYYVAPFNGNSPYVTRTPWAGHPGQYIKVNDYTMQSAVGGSTACNGAQILPIGTVAHETGHAFGLPDLYDTGDGGSEGIGEWGLMGSGNYTEPYSPSRMEAWSLLELGWIDVDSLGASGTVRLDPVTSSHRAAFVRVPNTSEYFLIENRQDLLSDSAQMNPALGSRAKQPGLLIWHIDQNIVDAHAFHGDNAVNAGVTHGVELIQADGQNNLDQATSLSTSNRGDVGDSYPGGSDNHRLSLATVPAALSNAGQYVGFIFDSIYQVVPHGQMIFRFFRRQPSLFAAGQIAAAIKVNGSTMTSYSDVLTTGDTLNLSADSVQLSADSRGRFEFRGWSDHAPLTHTYRAGASVDTVKAAFAAEYQLSVQLANALPGAVVLTNPPPGSDLATGVFLPGGTTATLTATAPAGTIFGGWTGDTVAASPTLALPVNRPFALTASFVSQVEVTVDAAANTLLGTATLTSAQASYLDARGNHNGIYDLGDFLAYARATGVSPSPGVMRQLLARTVRPAVPATAAKSAKGK